MQIFGLTITRTKAAVAPIRATDGGWRSFIWEPFAGAWQRNIRKSQKDILAHYAVYACIDRIAQDIGKLRLRLVEKDADGIETETDSAAFSPVLRKPNRYQTRQKFIEQWIHSKLINGNAYIWKERDERNIVIALYVLDPTKVRAFVAPDGQVFYQIGNDNLSGIQETSIQVPASEIIHDVMSALYHPLCGVSPLTACLLAASQGLNIQEHSSNFFANASNPGGILTAPGHIPAETVDSIKKQWEEKFSGANVGRIFVTGDGLKYEKLAVNATDAQLIEQLEMTGKQVCTCFHVPAYKVGIGDPPAHNNISALNVQYYSEALQGLIEAIEALLDEGLALPTKFATNLNLDDLLLMDMLTRIQIEKEGKDIFKPNESRKKFNLPKVTGGDDVYRQQQDFSLAALAKRDAKDDPFGTSPAPTPEPTPEPDDDESDEDVTRNLIAAIERKFHETRIAA